MMFFMKKLKFVTIFLFEVDIVSLIPTVGVF